MDKPLFSIILLHYNQAKYVKSALDSIFIQNYANIELIFADDASPEFKLEDIAQHIELNKKDNIKRIDWQLNSKNLGTVKTLNAAVKKCTGKYLLFFAADDQLYDQNVISKFYDNLKKSDSDIYMVSSQCHMMDIKMKKKLYDFVNPSFASSFNKLSAEKQFGVFAKSCFLAMGATSMKMDIFEKYGYFNEKYKYIEDWSYFLHLTRHGGRMQYCNFNGLRHRDGGVSHCNDAVLPPHVLLYKLDMVKIFENEILPYMSSIDKKDTQTIVSWYKSEKAGYIMSGGDPQAVSNHMILKYMPVFCIKRIIWGLVKRSPVYVRNASERLVKFNIFWLTLFFMYQFFEFQFIKVCLYVIPFVILTFVAEIILLLSLGVLLRVYSLIKKIFRRIKY